MKSKTLTIFTACSENYSNGERIGNRGETDHFITKVEVLENFGNAFNGQQPTKNSGRTIDTIYVVIDRTK